ncbi:unnamed protein product [Urochloa humidicola]
MDADSKLTTMAAMLTIVAALLASLPLLYRLLFSGAGDKPTSKPPLLRAHSASLSSATPLTFLVGTTEDFLVGSRCSTTSSVIRSGYIAASDDPLIGVT